MFFGFHPNECIGQQKGGYTAYNDCPRHLVLFYPLVWIGRLARLNEGAFAALGGLAVAFFTFTLWRSTDKLWSAGERQLRLAEDTARRQLRAYISVRKAEFTDFVVGRPFKIEIVFVNTGQTPARRVKMTPRAAASENPNGPFKIGTFRDMQLTTIDVGAGEPFTIGVDGVAPLDEEIRQGMIKKEYFIIVGCLVRYSDVFGRRHRFIMRGFVSFDGKGNPRIQPTAKNNRGD